MTANTLEVKDLCVSFFRDKGEIKAVNHVSLAVPAGKIVGIVGESGCGKSMTARAVMGLVKKPGKVIGGNIFLEGRDITNLSGKERCALRGEEISMVFQEPMTSLNPVIRVGKQVEEALRVHHRITGAEARKKGIQMFADVGIPDAERRYDCFPHQLSGGLRQRVLIAMAMICRPKLLIADEPTTALDVMVEAQILRLMKQLCAGGTSILIISHNLGVIAQICDYVYVMYAGRILEEADTLSLFEHPLHPYTRGLLAAVSSLRSGTEHLQTIPGVVPNLLHLPAGCSFSLRCGECLDFCGERMPEFYDAAPGHRVLCHRAAEYAAGLPAENGPGESGSGESGHRERGPAESSPGESGSVAPAHLPLPAPEGQDPRGSRQFKGTRQEGGNVYA